MASRRHLSGSRPRGSLWGAWMRQSFVTADLGLAVARKAGWAGRDTLGGTVVYVTAEGATGFRKRMVAYRAHHRLSGSLPFYMIADAPDLEHVDGDAHKLCSAI